MGETTKISWTDHTFNPWIGCTKVSAGCANCYAEALDGRWGHDSWGPGKPRRRTSASNWNEPIKWNAKAKAAGRRARVFCASLADVFDAEAPEGALEDLWTLIRLTPSLDWLLLTKRPERIRASLPKDWGAGYPNVWLGTSVENQAAADERIPVLLGVPARVRFLSCEPLLGPVSIQEAHTRVEGGLGIHWAIVGGESGPGFRPMSPVWARNLRDECGRLGVAFFYKQDGGLRPGKGSLDGVEHHAFPVVA